MPQTAFVSAPYTGFDSFTRANQSGWGTSTDGQVWSALTGGTYTLAISGNEGTITCSVAGAATTGLGTRKVADAEAICRIAFSGAAANESLAVMLRQVSASNEYIARLTGTSIDIAKVVAGTLTSLVSTTLTVASNAFFWTKFRVSGKNLSAKWWLDGSAEPSAWTLTTTDTTFTGIGQFGFRINATAGDVLSFDHFSVRSLDTIIQAHTGVGRIG